MIVKKGDYIETKIGGVYGEVLNVDREKRTVYIKLSPNSPLTDLQENIYVDMKLITKVYPKYIYVVDYTINEGKENEDIIYDEFDNIRSARKRFKEVIKNKSNKYARICKRLSKTYEIIEDIDEDFSDIIF